MTGKLFSLHKRIKKNKSIYYCQFKLPDDSWSTAKSTGQTSKVKAENWAIDYLRAGKIIKSENTTLEEFAVDFFSWDGEWAIDKKATGKRISERQCINKQRQTELYLLPALGKYKLTKIDRAAIKTFRNELYKRGLSGSTINKTLCNLHTILDYACDQSLIKNIPKVEKVANNEGAQKGILSKEETKELFSLTWPDYRAYVMNLTAASTGLRRGELQALQIKNFHGDYIEVEKSYDPIMKRLNTTTKNGRTRRVIIPGMVKQSLITLIASNPYEDQDSFIFFSEFPERPIHGEYVNSCLYKAMESIGISETERKRRHITFHSWRAAFNSWLINAKIPLAKVMSLTGHISPRMAQETYFRLDDLEDVKLIQESIFTASNEVIEIKPENVSKTLTDFT